MNRGLDSPHTIIEATWLKGGAKLHRFKNYGGAEMSAIYIGNFEAWWQPRKFELNMVKAWNKQPFEFIEAVYFPLAAKDKTPIKIEDGCTNCRYEDIERTHYPCSMCKRKVRDFYKEKDYEKNT